VLALFVAIVLLALVAAALVTMWVVRRSGGDDEGGDPVEPTSPGPDGPIDWSHFDRERERWERSRTK